MATPSLAPPNSAADSSYNSDSTWRLSCRDSKVFVSMGSDDRAILRPPQPWRKRYLTDDDAVSAAFTEAFGGSATLTTVHTLQV